MAESRATTERSRQDTRPRVGETLVTLASDLVGAQTTDGRMVSSDLLGVGVVQALGPLGEVCVHWADANIDTQTAWEDLCPLGPEWHLLTVQQRDRHGRQFRRHSFPVALSHHWTVELLASHMVRAVRADGLCWTFVFNTLTREVEPPWLQQLDDDEAEAIVAADLAMAQLNPTRNIVVALIHRVREILASASYSAHLTYV